MKKNRDAIVAITKIFVEAEAMNIAALDGDFDEARFRSERIGSMAAGLQLNDLALAAADLREFFGPHGCRPGMGFGAAIVRVADELDALRF